MSEALKQIEKVLADTESRLRALIAKAAQAGDYAGIDAARMAAGGVQQLISAVAPGARNDDSDFSPAHGETTSVENRRTNSGRQPPQSEYPRFYIQHDVLYKVGWSKKESEEYTHKIPKVNYEHVLRAIGGLVLAGKRLLTSEDIAQTLEAKQLTVPIYQVYLVLALLRKYGLIHKKGRDGYNARRDVASEGTGLWRQLDQ